MTRPASRFRIIDYPTRRHTRLESAHEAQLLSYLKAAEFEVGLLLNFGNRPQFRRLLLDNARKQAPRNAPWNSHFQMLRGPDS